MALTDKQISDIMDYTRFNGKTMKEWFGDYADKDLNRIFAAVQKGVSEEGLSVPQVMKEVFGTKDKPGAVHASRESARMLSRTLTLAASNHASFEEYKNLMMGLVII